MFERLHRQRRPAPPVSDDAFAVATQRDGDRCLVVPAGELDLTTAWQLEYELRRAEASDACQIVLDLRSLRLIDSAGVRVLLEAGARSRTHDKRLVLLRGVDGVQQRLEWSGLTTLLTFVDRDAVTSSRAV